MMRSTSLTGQFGSYHAADYQTERGNSFQQDILNRPTLRTFRGLGETEPISLWLEQASDRHILEWPSFPPSRVQVPALF